MRERLLAGLPVSERRLDVDGVETAVLEGGDGAPLVLLHGVGSFAAEWGRVIPQLARRHRIIAPDLPGIGEWRSTQASWMRALRRRGFRT